MELSDLLDQESPEYKKLQSKALEQLMSGKSLTGDGGVFAPLLKKFLEAALETEMESHLSNEERSKGNKRNGKGSKIVKTSFGNIPIETPEDRRSSFKPQIIEKRSTVLADNLAPKIIGLYGKGMSLRDISDHIQEMYDVRVSATTLSDIVDRIIPEVEEWQNRPLNEVYPIVWLDAMHYKVKCEGRVVSRAVYNILAINTDGYKDLIGMYIAESEGANYWLNVLTDLKARGVKDILIACTDNLTGFSEAIMTVYPKVEIQKCIIHQIRNSLKYVANKNRKEFMKDLKFVYKAVNKNQAAIELDKLDNKWGDKYPIVIRSWRNNWEELTSYFAYDDRIRKLIYTTNAVEGFHRQVRKVTKTKGVFPTDMSLMKLIYLAVQNISKKWSQPLKEWPITLQQLSIRFGDRVKFNI